MPLAILRHSNRVPEGVVDTLKDMIQFHLAQRFHCEDEGGDLNPGDIEVEVSEVGPKDRNEYDICITVLANDFPSRRANLDERRRLMQADLAGFIPPDLTGYLWVLLCPASFGEFNKEETT